MKRLPYALLILAMLTTIIFREGKSKSPSRSR